MQLHLATTRNFNGNELACYVDDKPTDEYDFWATREQIGKFLGYSSPRKSIGKIHERNKERLDKFSSALNLRTEAGMRTTTVYSFKGLLEVCRFSNQPSQIRSLIFYGTSLTRLCIKAITCPLKPLSAWLMPFRREKPYALRIRP